MFITDFDSSEEERNEKRDDVSYLKWRRSGTDRRLEGEKPFFEEKRGLINRRINWFELISNFVFPRHSKIK